MPTGKAVIVITEQLIIYTWGKKNQHGSLNPEEASTVQGHNLQVKILEIYMETQRALFNMTLMPITSMV